MQLDTLSFAISPTVLRRCDTATWSFSFLLLVAAAIPLPAQTAKPEVVELEAFEVQGFRSSLADAIEAKREAGQVMDTITAEQAGLFGDQNIGEAIQRISGVSLTRNNGEGEFITIRGLAPEFTRVEIDGRSTAMTADQSNPGRAVLLSVFSSNLFNTIEVVKSPTAADTEGGVGGIVRLKTAKPLTLGRMRWGVEMSLTDAELRDDIELGYSAFFSNVYNKKRLGLLLGISYQKRDRRLDKIQTGDPVWQRAVSANPALDGGRYPARLRLEGRTGEMPKLNVNAKVQYLATSDLELYLDSVVTREERHENKSRIQVEFSRGTFIGGTIDAATGTLTSGQFTRQRVDYNDFTRDTDVETTGVTAGAIWTNKTWRVEAKASSSYSKEDFDEYQAQARINADGAGGYDLGDDPRTPAVYTASTGLPASSIVLRGLNDNKRIISIGEDEYQLDARRTLDAGIFTSLRGGVRAAESKFKRRQGGPPSAPLRPDGRALTFADGVTPFILNGSFGFGRGGADFLTTWPEIDAKEMYFRYAPSGPVVFDNNNIYTIKENNRAAYVMGEFRRRFGEAVARGNLGVRAVQTKYDGTGRIIVTTPTGSVALDDRPALRADYTEPLPSFNFTVLPREDSKLMLRGAFTRAMTRPTVGQISPTMEIDTVDRSIVRGQPGLSPFLAWQYDLGLEFYFGRTNEGLVSIAGFDKDVENFIVPSSATETLAFPEQGVGAQDYAVSTFRNGGEAAVRGFEFNLQSPFTFLPGFLRHLGGAVNYTYTDSRFTDENGNTFTFPGASENTCNIVLYYQQKGFSTRFAYNYRDDYLIEPPAFADGSNALYGEGQGRLDWSMRYRFKNGLRLSFDALNLTREQSYKFYDIPQRYQNFEFEGRILSFGIAYSF